MRILPVLLAAGLACVCTASAQSTSGTATTNPVGYITVNCPAGSDTILSVPFHQSPAFVAPLSAAPSISGSTATLDFSATGVSWTANQFAGSYYVRFTAGTKIGSYYTVTANTSNTLTIALNGDTLSAVASGDGVKLIAYWTLDTLFPPATQTTVVASAGTLGFQRKTELLFPDLLSQGINLAPNRKFYLNGTTWTSATGTPAAGSTIILPDSYFILRHPSTVSATTFSPAGTVEISQVVSPLFTQTSGQQDNFVALTRPVPVALKDSGLASSFVASAGNLGFQRRDELLVFDNTIIGINKAPSAKYYMVGTSWINASGATNADNDLVFQPGTGVIVRKYQNASSTTAFWQNTPTY